MAIMKQFLKSRPECKVKFVVSAEEVGNAQHVALVGDFNDWDKAAQPMKKQKDGSFHLTVTLPSGISCKFRYLADGERWLNDTQADGYEYCQFSAQTNCVVSL